jgi:hypothetical protein
MAEVADFVVITNPKVQDVGESASGKWTSRVFATGGRNKLIEGGVELHNAYISLRLFIGDGGEPDRLIRVIVNDNPLPLFVVAQGGSETTAVATFPAGFLKDGGGNHVKLHAKDERSFTVLEAIVHFRQNS